VQKAIYPTNLLACISKTDSAHKNDFIICPTPCYSSSYGTDNNGLQRLLQWQITQVVHTVLGGNSRTACPIICAGPAPNVKCCPVLGIGVNINRHELMNYKQFILLLQRLTNHAVQSAQSSCMHCIPFRSAIRTAASAWADIAAWPGSQRPHGCNWLTMLPCMNLWWPTTVALVAGIDCCWNRLHYTCSVFL